MKKLSHKRAIQGIFAQMNGIPEDEEFAGKMVDETIHALGRLYGPSSTSRRRR